MAKRPRAFVLVRNTDRRAPGAGPPSVRGRAALGGPQFGQNRLAGRSVAHGLYPAYPPFYSLCIVVSPCLGTCEPLRAAAGYCGVEG